MVAENLARDIYCYDVEDHLAMGDATGADSLEQLLFLRGDRHAARRRARVQHRHVRPGAGSARCDPAPIFLDLLAPATWWTR
ncbi:hypothetical protein QJS66_11550 [Kocuria rhizophila]|nr:hypothetical protein QJS66_11550 [Kocuria rhizophila]